MWVLGVPRLDLCFMGSWVPRLDLCFMGSKVGFMVTFFLGYDNRETGCARLRTHIIVALTRVMKGASRLTMWPCHVQSVNIIFLKNII